MKIIKFVGNLLFWLTLISPIVAFVIMFELGEVDVFDLHGVARYTWGMWLFIPIGIASIIAAAALKKKNLPYKKNIVVALVCIPCLILWGACGFWGRGTTQYNDVDKIPYVEAQTKLDLPDHTEVVTDTFFPYHISYAKTLDKQEKLDFEEAIASNPLWLTELAPEVRALLPTRFLSEMGPYQYYVLYNTVTGEYNSYPADGEECIFIAYDAEVVTYRATVGKLLIIDKLTTDAVH